MTSNARHNYLNTKKSNIHTKVHGNLVQLWFGNVGQVFPSLVQASGVLLRVVEKPLKKSLPKISMISKLALIGVLSATVPQAAFATSYVEDADSTYGLVAENNAQNLVDTLFGRDMTSYMVGAPTLVGGGTTTANSQTGYVNDMDDALPGYPETAIMFSSGFINNAGTSNTAGDKGNNESALGNNDPDFNVGNGEEDVASLEFTVNIPSDQTVSGRFFLRFR